MDFPTLINIMSQGGAPQPVDASHALSRTYAEALDSADPLRPFCSEFHIPTLHSLSSSDPEPIEPAPSTSSQPCIYFCGNSLGLQPKRTAAIISEELSIWAARGVTGHFNHPKSRPWVSIDENVTGHLAGIVGAAQNEVAAMGSLTANIHLLLAGFYRPTEKRWKVIMEGRAFPSDHYAIVSQLQWHGHSEESGLVLVNPIHPSPVITTSQILSTIDQHADETALLFLPGVQYYTGQAFDIATITEYAQSKGITVGWDLAHAAGNIELKLHDWGVDFAAWCSYKFLNSGPGGIAGIFVHEKHDASSRHRLAGWWGHDRASRFQMDTRFLPLPGASGYQLSNPSVLDTTAHLSSLELFTQATPALIHLKSRLLTSYLYYLLSNPPPLSYPPTSASSTTTSPPLQIPFQIITPADPAHRGAQLSIYFPSPTPPPPPFQPQQQDGTSAPTTSTKTRMMRVYEKISAAGVVVDERKPDVIRIAPVPLYNSFEEVWEFCQIWWMKVWEVVVEERVEEGRV